jgi:hypothetical protein
MARVGQDDRTVKLLTTVYELLFDHGQPIHYKELTKVLIDSGVWENPWGKEPDQILYSAMHNEFRRYGTDCRFLFLGKGFVCASTVVEGIEFFEQAGGKVPPSRPPKESAQPAVKPEAATCGNCTHLYWAGPNVVSHEAGSCSKYRQSKRSVVFKNSQPCQMWAVRTSAQANKDRLEKTDQKLEMLVMLRTGEHSLEYKRRHRGQS